MATDPNTIGGSAKPIKESGNCNFSSMVKRVASDGNEIAHTPQIRVSGSSQKRNVKSGQLSSTDCKKTISCDSRKERNSPRKLHSGSYAKFTELKHQGDFRTRNFNSSPTKVNSSKNSRVTRLKVRKLNSSCESVIYSKDRKKFVEDLVSQFEKGAMNSKKNYVKRMPRNAKLIKSQLNTEFPRSAGLVPSINLCQMKPSTAQSSESRQSACAVGASSVGINNCQKQSKEMLGCLLPGTCKTQSCKCPADTKCSDVPLFKSTLFYNDCSDSASSRIVILASCVNEYIKTVFQQLDHQNKGSISVEEFESLCRVLGISSSLSHTNKRASWVNLDGRIELPGFEKLMWKCVSSENQKLPVSLEERRSSTVLAHSVLCASRRLQSLENITDDLRDISKSMANTEKLTRASSDESLPNSKRVQYLGKNDSNLDSLKEFSESSFVCYEENKRMKSIIEDLRKALQASDAENLALRVKMEMAETLGTREENSTRTPQKRENGRKSGSKADFISANGSRRLSVDSTYSTGRSNQSTPLWTRKRQFFDELLSYYQPTVQKNGECSDTSFTNNNNRDSESLNCTNESENEYLCMELIPGRSPISKVQAATPEAESIYAPLGETPLSFDYAFKLTPKPSPRRLKMPVIGYSPNRARLHRSGLSRKSTRIYENFLPPTPPSIDSIPKRPSVILTSTTTSNETHSRSASEQKENSDSAINERVRIEASGIPLAQQSVSQDIARNGRLSMIIDSDKVQLKKETEIGSSNIVKQNLIFCPVTTFSDNCSFPQAVTATSSSVTRLPNDKFSHLGPMSMSADDLDCQGNLHSSSSAPGSRSASQSDELLQSSKSLNSAANSIDTPTSSCLISKSAVKKFMRHKKGVSVPELSSIHLNSGWHATLRHSASHLQDEATPHSSACNEPRVAKLRSQPLPQLLATKAMLEATLNAVLLNNRLIADHGVRSLTPDALRRRYEVCQERISFFGQDAGLSRSSISSSTSSEEENKSIQEGQSVDKCDGSEHYKVSIAKTESAANLDSKKDSIRSGTEHFVLEEDEEKFSFVNKKVNENLSKNDEKLSLSTIPKFRESLSITGANMTESGQPNKVSPVPFSVDELLAELTDYCKETGVDISSPPSNDYPTTHFTVGNATENSNRLRLYTLDEAVESRKDATETKATSDMAVSEARFDLVHESSAHAIKSAPTEEIYISSSGSDDSGRGDSEGSCSSPDDLTGGSDDGLWTAEDDSPSSDIVHNCKGFPEQGNLSCYFHRSKLSAQDAKANYVDGQHNAEKSLLNNSNTSVLQSLYSCHGCGKAFCNCSYISQKTKDIDDPKIFNHSTDATIGSNHRLENGSSSKEVYDNIDGAHANSSKVAENNGFISSKKLASSHDTEIQIIDLDEPESASSDGKRADKLISEKEFHKTKGFLGRRCRSFNTFRSFLSHTASQLKRNSSGRSSFSLPRVSAKTYEDFSTDSAEKEPPKSIVKRPLSDYREQKKKKRISFRDTVDVFPIKCQGSKILENKPLRFDQNLGDLSENFPDDRSPIKSAPISREKVAGVSVITYVKVDQTLPEKHNINSVKTLIPANYNNVTLVAESDNCSDPVHNLPIPTMPTMNVGNLRCEEPPNVQHTNQTSVIPSTDAEDAKAKHIPESRALLEALENDLEVILKALTEDESKIL